MFAQTGQLNWSHTMIVRRYTLLFSLVVSTASLLTQPGNVSGQLIGNQSIGGPALSLTQQRSAGNTAFANIAPGLASNAIGSLGNRMQIDNTRFVRGNRSRQDFVGSNRNDLTGFVGSSQALGVGRVPSAAENLRLESRKTKVNRPLPLQPANGMYYPRLEIDFTATSTQSESLRESPANADTKERIAEFSAGNATVMMSGNTAILRGTVRSARAAELLEQLLSFEPGIDRVKNELVIQ